MRICNENDNRCVDDNNKCKFQINYFDYKVVKIENVGVTNIRIRVGKNLFYL